MTTLAFLGLGEMGSRLARNLLDAGTDLVVWNRSADRMQPLIDAGARAADTPRQAGQMADIVLSMVADDAASQDVWLGADGALGGMSPGKTAIEISTLTPGWVQDLGGQMQARGVDLIEAPVSGTLPQAEGATLVFFLAGDDRAIAATAPHLAPLGRAFPHVGQWGDGARVKLATNAVLGINVAIWAEVLSMLDRSPTDTARAVDAIAQTGVWAGNSGYLTGAMMQGDHAPKFPVALLDKDIRYALGVAGDDAPLLRLLHERLQRAIDAGYGDDNMTALRKLHG